MEDLVVLRDIQGLGFDTLNWFKDRSQWLKRYNCRGVLDQYWLLVILWTLTLLPVTVEGFL